MQITNQSKLGILILFCIALVVTRVIYTDTPIYVFLIWNLFLGAIPFLLSKLAVIMFEKGRKLGTTMLVLLCILFLPNAPYIVTDLFHLHWNRSAPLWFDSVMIFSFALTGLILFFRALANLEHISRQLMRPPYRVVMTVVIIFASAFGMYLGRYLRFNSWDVISDPLHILTQVAQRILYPFEHTQAWSMTLVYGLFLTVLYFFVQTSERQV